MPPIVEPAMTVRDVAAFLNVDEKTIYRLAQKGDLPGFKVLGSWRFQKEDVGQWIKERKLIAQSADKKKLNPGRPPSNGNKAK
jgi:excisionase family DNA binding protein